MVDLLRGVGLPRGEISTLRAGFMRGYGAKLPDCELRINVYWLQKAHVQLRRPELVLRTWIEESIHARQPFSDDWSDEYSLSRGYEEGLAACLTEHLLRKYLALESEVNPAYVQYVRVYEQLARTLLVEPEAFCRLLWRHAPGQVRRALPTTAAEVISRRGRALAALWQSRLLEATDPLMTFPVNDPPLSRKEIGLRWQRMLE